jgi:hypothetical protein
MGASPDRHQWGNHTIGAQLFLKGRLSLFPVGMSCHSPSYLACFLARYLAAKSRDRIAKLGIRSDQVDRFVDSLWFNPELTLAEAEKMLEEPLKTWLEDSSEYNPEGWALSVLGGF